MEKSWALIGGLRGGVGGDGGRGRGDVVAVAVGDGGVALGVPAGVGGLGVADGVGDGLDGVGHAGVPVGARPGRPAQAAPGAGRLGPGGADLGQVVAEDVGGAAAVGAVHDGDVGVGQPGAGVEDGKGRVVPLGDLAEEDLRENGAGELQPRAVEPRHVVGDGDGAEVNGDLERGAAPRAGEVGGAGGDVGGAEVDLPGGEAGDAGAAADRVVADRGGRMGLLVGGEREVEERRVEGRPGAGQVGHGRGARRGGAGRGARARGERGGQAERRGGGGQHAVPGGETQVWHRRRPVCEQSYVAVARRFGTRRTSPARPRWRDRREGRRTRAGHPGRGPILTTQSLSVKIDSIITDEIET